MSSDPLAREIITSHYPYRAWMVMSDGNSEASAWLQRHCPDDYFVESVSYPKGEYSTRNIRLAFRNEADAVAFKLKFGGNSDGYNETSS